MYEYNLHLQKIRYIYINNNKNGSFNRLFRYLNLCSDDNIIAFSLQDRRPYQDAVLVTKIIFSNVMRSVMIA